MKTALISLAVIVVCLLCLPLLISGGPSGTAAVASCPVTGGRLAVALATIRTVESGNDYTARAAGSSASGAYQFIDTTWGGYSGYTEAWMAPPAVQDAKAAINVSAVLADQHGDVTAVPVVWYIGHLPAPDSPERDTVPYPSAGNVLTPREYQAKWMGVYDELAGHARPTATTADTHKPTTSGCSMVTPTTTTARSGSGRAHRR